MDSNNIIQNDRGYFFYYQKAQNKTSEIENCQINGTPGNNREYWNVECKLVQFKSISEGYKYFRKRFPYGAEGLLIEIPNSVEFLDKKNGVIYTKSEKRLQIIKDNPMGKIFILIEKEDNSIFLKYEMQYPEY